MLEICCLDRRLLFNQYKPYHIKEIWRLKFDPKGQLYLGKKKKEKTYTDVENERET